MPSPYTDDMFDKAAQSYLQGEFKPANDPNGTIDSIADGFVSKKQQNLRSNLLSSSKIAPEQAAQDYLRSKKYDLPIESVRQNKERIDQQEYLEQYNIHEIGRDTPKLANRLADPATGPVMRDDVDNLSYWERWTRDFKQASKAGEEATRLGDIGFDLMLGNEISSEDRLFLNRSQKRETLDFDIGFIPGIPGAVAESAPLFFDVLYDSAQISAGAGTALGATYAGGAAIGGQLGPQAATPEEVVTVPAAFATGFFQGARTTFVPATTLNFAKKEAGNAFVEYSQFTDENGQKIEHEVAAGAAIFAGTVNSVMETVGLKVIAKTFPGGDKLFQGFSKEVVQSLMKTPAARAAFSRIGLAATKAGGVEGFTEALQEATTILTGEIAKAGSDLDFQSFAEEGNVQAFWEGFLERITEAGVRGAQGGAGFGATGTSVGIALEAGQARLAHQREQKSIEEMRDKARESKVLARDPTLFKEYLRDNFDNDSVYINPEDAKTFFQDNPEQLEEVAAYLPDVEAELNRALAEGTDMNLPRSEVVAAFGQTEALDPLIPSMRLSEESMTSQEFESLYVDALVDEFADVEQTGLTDAEVFERRIESQLTSNVGYTPDVARQLAPVFRSYYESIQNRIGDNSALNEVFNQAMGGLQIRRELPESIQRRIDDIDIFIDEARTFLTSDKKRGRIITPLTDYVRETLGGIDPQGTVGQELAAQNVTRKEFRKAFKTDGIGDVDNLPLSEVQNVFADYGITVPSEDGVYADRQWIIDTLTQEGQGDGQPVFNVDNDKVAAFEDLSRELGDRDIDIETATNDQIRDALDLNQGTTLNQDAQRLAPNGQPSNLDARLYDVVRTPEFKEWFGDWENDPENASKVVDENGEPLVVYHGTGTTIEEFKYEFTGQGNDQIGSGFYFTDDITQAQDYTTRQLPDGSDKLGGNDNPNVVEAFLNIRNPVDSEADGNVSEQQIRAMLEYAPESALMDGLSNWGDVDFQGVQEVLSEAVDAYVVDESNIVRGLFSLANDFFGTDGDGVKAFNTAMREVLGIDGVKAQFEGFNHYVAFSPEQIKSAYNEGSFDPADPRILKQDKRGEIQFTDDGRSIITVMNGGDLSTVLHEGAHFFAENLKVLAQQDGAPDGIVSMWNTLAEWAGTDPGAEISTEAHEKIARGFEAYIREGNAPNAELLNVFQRMKAWLVRIYKSVKELDVNLTNEVRDVFDRMLASDEQIEALRSNPAFQPDPAVLELLNEQQKKDYIRRTEKSMAEAKDRLLKKLLKQKEREGTKEWKEEFNRAVKEAEKQVATSPLYQAVNFLQKGEYFLYETPEGTVKARLDRKSVKEQYGNEVFKYLPRGIFAKKGEPTMPVETAADMFGFRSADEMMQGMMNYVPLKEKVNQIATDTMLERHGDMLRDGTIEREALQEAHNEARAKQIEAEMRVAASRAGIEYPRGTDFKEAAKRLMAGKSIDYAVKAAQFYNAEIKASRQYGAAMANKDYVAAADAKRRQLLNHYMYKESLETQKFVEKSLKKFNKLNKEPPKKKPLVIDREYHEKIWEVLDKYNLRPRLSDKKRARLEAEALADWMERKTESGDAQMIYPAELIDANSKEHYRDLTVEQFRGLRDVVDNLESQGRKLNTMMVEGKRREIKELGQELASNIRENLPERSKKVGARGGFANEARFYFNSGLALLEKAGTLMQDLDGGKRVGAVYRAMKRRIDEEIVKLGVRMRDEVAEPLYDIMVKHYGKSLKVGGNEIPMGISTLAKRNIYSKEFDQKLSKLDIIGIALHQGNADNKQKFAEGWNLTQGQVDALLNRHMDKRDWDYVQDIWDLHETFWPEIAEKQKERTGVAPEKVQISPVETKHGSYRGGYFHIEYEARESTRAKEHEVNELADLIRSGGKTRAQTRRGHTKERVKNVKRPVRFDHGVIDKHFREMMRDLVLGDAVSDAAKLLNQKDFREAIEDTRGVESVRMLELWLSDVAAGGLGSSDMITAALQRLRTRTSMGIMIFNIGQAWAQASGFTQSAAELGPKYTFVGMMKAFNFLNPARTYYAWQEIFNESQFMRERYRSLNRDMADSIRSLEGKGQVAKYTQLGYQPIMKAQMAVDIPLWMGAYEKAVKQDKLSHKDAITSADRAVAEAQGSGFIQDLSAIERGTVSSNQRFSEGWKLFTFMYTYMNTKLNVAMRSARRNNIHSPLSIFKNDPRKTAAFAGDMVMLFMLEAMLFELLKGRVPDFDEEDDPEIAAAWWGMKVTGLNVLGTVPLAREVGSVLNGFDASPGAFRGIGDIGKTITGTSDLIEDYINGEDPNLYKYGKTTTRALNLFTPYPLPVSQINIILDAMERDEQGKEVTPLNYLLYLPKE